MKIQPMQNLKKEMLSVARGERKAPADAAQISFESVDATIRLLTPENRTWAERNAEALAAHGTDISATGLAGAEFDRI